MKLGLCSYTNRNCGVGLIAADLVRWLPIDSMLSVYTVKGQEQWLDRQRNMRSSGDGNLGKYLDEYQPDVLLGIETLFSAAVYEECRRRGVKTAVVMMHESYRPGLPIDRFICPTQIAYERIEEPHKVFFPLPFDIEPFPFRLRTEARRFLHVCGYGMRNNRRQTREVVNGFFAANIPDSTLTVHCQRDWRKDYGEWIDERVEFRLATLPEPAEVYAGFDVLVQPDAYAGYNRLLYEAQACGLPVITTDAPPMDECREAMLVPVDRQEWLEPRTGPDLYPVGRCMNVMLNLVTAEAVAVAVRVAAEPSVAGRSRAGRKAAEARAWTKDKAAEFLQLLEANL